MLTDSGSVVVMAVEWECQTDDWLAVVKVDPKDVALDDDWDVMKVVVLVDEMGAVWADVRVDQKDA